MITNLTLRNFKLHNHTSLKFKGLTILTGMNGMGKSTIIQSLILLRQSYMMGDLDAGLNLKGDLCDAGMSGELACQASQEHYLYIGLQFCNQEELRFAFLYPNNIMDTMLPGLDDNQTSKTVLSKYSLFNENFQYLSAYRFGPQKSYNRDTSLVVSKKQMSKTMGQCEYAVHFLEQYKNTNIPIEELAIIEDSDITCDYRLAVQVERWLRLISPNIKINIEPTGEDFKLKYKFNREENTITDDITALNTGFGITYVLPILIAILSANKDAIIIVENPEAHIHPKGQAVLMALISKAVTYGVQVIIESHSDHIINGALVAVNKKIITRDSLSIYYFEREEHGHTALSYQLQVSDTGRISHPPKGFFDQIDIDYSTLSGF